MDEIFPSPSPVLRLRQLLRFSRLWKKAQRHDLSFAGEWREIERLLKTIGVTAGTVVDIAASDGVSQSSTIELFKNPNWRGLAVEMDPIKFAKLSYVYSGYRNVQLAKCCVTPANVANLLRAHEIPSDFDLLNLDIDSYDLFVIDEMLRSGFRPKVVSMEINETVPPPLYFTVLYDPSQVWNGDRFFGCSAVAAAQTLRASGYVLALIEYNNAMFVRADLADGKIDDVPTAKAYSVGYANKPDRASMFPWNSEVDCALTMNAEEARSFFSKLFGKYDGRFELRIDAES